MNYSDYLDVVNFPSEINPDSIKQMEANEPEWWLQTYPHETFIQLLKGTAAMLARQGYDAKKSLWIHGAYGTGKSRLVATLKKLLECSVEDFNRYFDNYPVEFKSEPDLRTKLLAQRSSGKIITAFRYTTGEINDFSDFIMAIYEEVTKELTKAKLQYAGENTLKGGIIDWLEKDDANKDFFSKKIKKAEYRSFSSLAGLTADDVLAKLKNPNANTQNLIKEILVVAKNERIDAFSKKVEDVKAWLEDVIDRNNLKAIVFFWDEFSEFFKKNKNYLDTFQTFNELSNNKPFNMVIVTHTAIFGENDADGRKVRDRFNEIQIELPDNIAFNLIGHVIQVKESQKSIWTSKIETIQDGIRNASKAVAKYVWKDKENDGVKKLNLILPIHPLAALLLKYISERFASNQRSMFNFIKNNDTDGLKAFQWFINTHSPDAGDNLNQDDSLLTIDYLWNFFYEKGTDEHTSAAGRGNLDTQVRNILDCYAQNEGSSRINQMQKRVLKTILMMQAMSIKTNYAIPLLLPTEDNIDLAYNGLSWQVGMAKSVARSLLTEKILFKKKIGNGKEIFAASVASTDTTKIEEIKGRLRTTNDTAVLIEEGDDPDKISSTAVTLSKAQNLRFKLFPLTWKNFTADVNKIAQNTVPGDNIKPFQIPLVLLFAKTPEERTKLKASLQEKLADANNENIVFIDLTASNLSDDQFEQYLEYKAQEEYYRPIDRHLADSHARNAKNILKSWKSDIVNAAKTVYHFDKAAGINCQSNKEVQEALDDVVLKRYPKSFENIKFTDQTWINSQAKNSVKLGAEEKYGSIIPKSLPEFIQNNRASLDAVKAELDSYIQAKLRGDGRVAIADVWDVLQEKGFMPCNAYAYLTGWLLRDYADVKYRTSDGEPDNSKRMSIDSLAEIVSECVKHKDTPINRYKDKYIEILNPEQKAYVDLARFIWNDISDDQSVELITGDIRRRLTKLEYPLWAIKEEKDCQGAENFLDVLASLANVRNDDQRSETESSIVNTLGKMAIQNQNLGSILKSLLTPDNAKEAMEKFLSHFEDGALLQLAQTINAPNVMYDVKNAYRENGLWLWDQETGKGVISALTNKYKFVALSNQLLPNSAVSYVEALNNWDEKIKAIRIPFWTISQKRPAIKNMLKFFYDRHSNELPDSRIPQMVSAMESSVQAFKEFEQQIIPLFKETYNFYLTELTDDDVRKLYSELPGDTFYKNAPETQQCIAEIARSIKEGKKFFQLQTLWKEKTGTDSPRAWSEKYQTPILAMVPSEELAQARQAFNAVNNPRNQEPNSVQDAINYLQGNHEYMNDLNNQEKIDEAFMTKLVRKYGSLLNDPNEVRNALLHNSRDCYSWLDSADVRDDINDMGAAKYSEKGISKVQEKVDQMTDQQVKKLLMWLVNNSPETGIMILTDYEG